MFACVVVLVIPKYREGTFVYQVASKIFNREKMCNFSLLFFIIKIILTEGICQSMEYALVE